MSIHADHVKHGFPDVDTDNVGLHLIPFPFSIAATASIRWQTISLRLELVGRRQDVAFVVAEYGYSEREACKLMSVDRSSYRLRTAAGPQRGAAGGTYSAGASAPAFWIPAPGRVARQARLSCQPAARVPRVSRGASGGAAAQTEAAVAAGGAGG
jgi:hypothetical protein